MPFFINPVVQRPSEKWQIIWKPSSIIGYTGRISKILNKNLIEKRVSHGNLIPSNTQSFGCFYRKKKFVTIYLRGLVIK